MALLVRLFLIFACIAVSECILCYQCSDSSEKPGKNDCRTYVRTMNRDRERYLTMGSVNDYVKNCTGYKGLDELDIYCMITEVKVQGEESVLSYIRGCTDGKDFLDVDQSIEIEEKVNFENNTSCININRGLVACVTICGIEHGDFCNGYVSRAKRSILIDHHLLFVLLVFMSVL